MRFLIKTQNMVSLEKADIQARNQSHISIDSNGPWRVDPRRSRTDFRYGCRHWEQSFLLSSSLMGHWENNYQLLGYEPLLVVLDTVGTLVVIIQLGTEKLRTGEAQVVECCCLVARSCLFESFATPWTIAHQASLSMGFSRQEYWSGLLFPSIGDLPDSGIKPESPALQVDSLTTEPTTSVVE